MRISTIKELIFIIILLFSTGKGMIHGQDSQISEPDLDDSRIMGKVFYQNHFRVEGTPFFIDQWLTADILSFTNEWKKNVLVKYDAYSDELIYYNDNISIPVIIDKDYVQMFDIHESGNNPGYTFRCINLGNPDGRDNACGFFQVVKEGNVSLYIKHSVVYAKKINPEQQDKYHGRFVHKKEYFLQVGTEVLPIKMGVKTFVKLFPQHKKDIKEFIKKDNLSMKSEDDLRLLIGYINTLVA